MNTRKIPYRYAMLLCFAALVLVMNPVWHAIAHSHFDQPFETEQVSDTNWAAADLCPYCDAVPQQIAPIGLQSNIVPADFYSELKETDDLYHDLRLRVSKRLRAPPFSS